MQELKRKKSVIALGGGAYLNKSIRINARKLSLSFWLDISADKLIKRLSKTNKRPLLYKKNISDTIKKMYLDRKKIYSEANYRIRCTLLKPKEITDKILKLYGYSGN